MFWLGVKFGWKPSLCQAHVQFDVPVVICLIALIDRHLCSSDIRYWKVKNLSVHRMAEGVLALVDSIHERQRRARRRSGKW